jgi:hypothetical protein
MSYDLNIRRLSGDSDEERGHVSKAEWDALVQADPSLKVSETDYAVYQTDSGKEILHFVDWIDHPYASFLWKYGEISTNHPDKETTLKMIELAERLGAKVQGDEGEIYTGPEDYDRYALYGP